MHARTLLLGLTGCCCFAASSTALAWAAPHEPAALVEQNPMPDQPALDDRIKDVFDLHSFTIQNFDLPQGVEGPLAVRVRLGDRHFDLALAPYSMRSDAFQVLVDDGSGLLRRAEAPPICTLRGDALQDPNSHVRASLVHAGLNAIVELGDGSSYTIQQVAAEIPGVDPRIHVVYRDREVAPPLGFRCGVDDFVKPEAGRGSALRPVGGPGPAPRTTGDRITDIAFDADVEYYASLGSNVNNVVNDIESIMNAVEGIYEINTDISYEVTTVVVRTAEPDPYTSTNPGTLLDQFDTHWSGSLSAIRRDVAHLFTGKNIDGGVIGIARLSVICTTNSAFGLSQSRYTSNLTLRRSLTAHELGHNWSAQHCDNSGSCNIMCSCNGCGPPACTGTFTSFGAGEAAQIVAFRNSVGCLTLEPAPFTPPFSDDFPIATFDTNKWVYNDGAGISTASVNPPSPTRAVQLNAVGAGLYDDDDLRSNFIPLVGVTTPQLTYFVQARGVPSGKQLFVDVWTSALRWVNVNTVTSDGVDDTTFTQYTTSLNTVSGAIHSEFRVRFRPDVDSATQNWYVDNIYVGAPQGPATGACCLNDGTCITVTSANCATQSGNYQGDGTSCDTTVCPQPPGACCLNEGGCVSAPNLAICLASGGTWQGHGTSCGTAGCPEPFGACCLPSGVCVDVADEAACSAMGGDFQGAGILCQDVSCPPPNGACCLPSGACIETDAAGCAAQGGSFSGSGTTCLTINCPQPSGSCCLPSGICIETDNANCAAQGGAFNGVGTTCAGTMCPQPCPCDWNDSGKLTSQDFFDFLTGFFEMNADFNGDGMTGSQDFFDFIACFFNGC